MGLGRIVPAVLAGLAILGFALLSHSAQGQERVNDFAWRLLAAHNLERDRAGVARLRWSNKLAQDANAWAVLLAHKGRLEHASGDERRGTGENLWIGSAGYYTAEDMIGGFLAERQKFRPGTFPQVSRTGNWADVGHYTQLIWPSTQEVGCAVAKGEANDVLVCRYAPAGNMIGGKVG
jgi:uncharacterized protein YkwD